MAIALNVGLSQTIYPENGRLEVSCNVEFKIDIGSLQDIEGYDRTVEQAYFVCCQEVNDELERQQLGATCLNASVHNANGHHSSN